MQTVWFDVIVQEETPLSSGHVGTNIYDFQSHRYYKESAKYSYLSPSLKKSLSDFWRFFR